MKRKANPFAVLLVSVLLAAMTGCEEAKEKPPAYVPKEVEGPKWLETEELEDGTVLKLGVYSKGEVNVRAGDVIEPCVSIEKGDIEISDASVNNRLKDSRREWTLSFQSAKRDVPGHYAQAAFKIPDDVSDAEIQFRIRLPDSDEDLLRSLKFDFKDQP